MLRLRHFFFFCCLFAGVAVRAQQPVAHKPALPEPPASAIKCYNEALQYRFRHQPAKAIGAMQRAIAKFPAYTEAYATLGGWYLQVQDYQRAAILYKQAVNGCPNGAATFSLPLVKSLLGCYNANEALQLIPANDTAKAWKALLQQARFMQANSRRKATGDSIVSIGPPCRINSPYAELFPQIAADGKTLFLTRSVNGMDEDIFYALPDTCGGWLNAEPLGYPINTPAQEDAPTISPDRHYLFFTRCDNRSPNGWEGGGCDLFMAYTADSGWSVPQSFGATINTPAYEGMPCLSADDHTLYFVSNRDGGYGGKDIWCSHFEDGLWQVPVNLGPGVNTAGDETAPFLHPDGQTLYFASTGWPGMGAADIFVTQRTDDTTWSAPLNLGYPINTPADEASLSVSPDGQMAYLASDRDSSVGNYDVYTAPLPVLAQPGKITYVAGYVYDSISKERLNYGTISFTDSASNKEVYQLRSNRGDGSYMISLPLHHAYYLGITHIDAKAGADTLHTDSAMLATPMQRNFALLPVGYEKPVSDTLVLTIHFSKNVIDLDDTAKAAIGAALRPWVGNTAVTGVIINSYTDNSGTPILNEQLSYTRARQVAAVVRQGGFAAGIITVQGLGEANAVAPNDSEEHRDLNRRVEVIVRH